MKLPIYIGILISILCIGTLHNVLSTAPSPDPNQDSHSWSFAVIGDTQDAIQNTQTGINPDLPRLMAAIAAEKPDFVLHTGDITNGDYTTERSPVFGHYQEMYEHFMEAASPVYNYSSHTGIPIYPVRGNHDVGGLIGFSDLEKAYLTTLARNVPENGPLGEEKLSYSFIHKGAKFIGLDEYVPHDGEIDTVNCSWLAGQIATNATPFTFVWAHGPAYKVGTRDGAWMLPHHPKERDRFWKVLSDARVPIFFCGHIHLYTRTEADGVLQIVNGKGGGNDIGFDPSLLDPKLHLVYPKSAIPPEDQTQGYLMVTVDERNGTISGVQKFWNTMAGDWKVGDTFSLDVGK